MNKRRELISVKVREVSLVDKGANRKKFFVIKSQDAEKAEVQSRPKIKIDSDGTPEGTIIKIGGKTLTELDDFYFRLGKDWSVEEGASTNLSNKRKMVVTISYTVAGETDGFRVNQSFRLKRMEKGAMNELKKLYNEILNLDISDEAIQKLADRNIEKLSESADLLSQYSNDFTPELTDALAVIAKATLIPAETEKPDREKDDNKEDTEKKGARYSKKTLNSFKNLQTSLQQAAKLIGDLLGSSEEEKEDEDSKKKNDDSVEKDEGKSTAENKTEFKIYTEAIAKLIQNGELGTEKLEEVIAKFKASDNSSDGEITKDNIQDALSEMLPSVIKEEGIESDESKKPETNVVDKKDQDDDPEMDNITKEDLAGAISDSLKEELK